MQQSRGVADAEESEKFNLTTPQAGIWLDWNKGRDPSSYNICNVIPFDGRLDVDALWRAVVQADRENDALRLRFSNEDGEVTQSFAAACRPTDFSVIDLRYSDDAEAAAYREIDATRTRLLDPEKGFLCRHRLLHLGDESYWWVRVYHHLVCDGFAGHLLADRVSEIYRALRSGDAISECSFRSYRDFITSDARYSEGKSYERALAYWKERLKDDRTVTRFSARADTMASRHTQFPQSLSNAELDAINAAARTCGTSPASLMMGIFAVLLARISGESHPILTLSLLNRIGRDERNTPGAFSCVMPFDINLGTHQSISELAKDIFTRARRDVRHIRFGPVRMRAERLGPKSLAGGGAFFNSLDSMTPLDFDGVRAKRMNIYNAPVNDLGLVYFVQALSESENEAELIWQYNASRLDRETVEGIAARFRRLLNAVITDPEQDIAAVAEIVTEDLDELHLSDGDSLLWEGEQEQPPMMPPSQLPPTDKLHERQLAEKIKKIWVDLIETDDIPADTDLFEIGAHSLLVPRAQYRLSELIGRKILAVEVFEHRTINALARHLMRSAGQGVQPANRLAGVLETGPQEAVEQLSRAATLSDSPKREHGAL
ncbi:MAG: condensation domain-containing protein [Pseudomonadota bacterium]